MNNAREIIKASFAARLGVTGNGVGIAVLDTGINPIADFTMPLNRIILFKDFVNGRANPYDDNGHGTHVTGVACGNGYLSGGKYCGVAPESNIISLKVLDSNGQGSSQKALSAIQWIMFNHNIYNIRIVNLSVGTGDNEVNIPLLRAVNALWDMGIVVVAAAGNKDRCSPNDTAALGHKVITVGSLADRITCPIRYSSKQKYCDILCPATDIISCMGKTVTGEPVGRNYTKMSGTSMATPMVSAAAALVIEKRPELTPDNIKNALINTSSEIKGANPEIGLLDIENLLWNI